VETADLNRFLSIYNPKLFLIENYKTTADSIEEYRRNFITQYNLPAGQEYFPPLMYYSYYRSVEMLQEYERQHKINYDIIVKLRPDVIFPMQDGGDTYYHAQADLEKDITNVLSNPNALYQTSDLYWVSTGDTIKKANLFWEESLKAPNVSLWSYIRDVGIDLKKSENLDYTLLRNLWRHIPVDNYFMIDAFERFFLELPPKVNAVKNPGEDFHKQHFSELKSYIHNYSIIKELCDETGCTVN